MRKIVLYGGSFDPIHIGHLVTATNVVDYLDVDKLIFIPSNITPLKNNSLKASNIDRYNMLKLSTAKSSKLEVSDYEITKKDISYTYNTVKHFKKIYPKDELFFIVGTDRIKDLNKWYKISELAKMITFIFVARDRENIEQIISSDKFYKTLNYKILKLPIIDISSTKIREKIKNKQDINYILVDECIDYIKERDLYDI